VAGSEEFFVVRFDFRRASPVGTGVMEQHGTSFFCEVAEVHTKHAAPRQTFATLKIGKVSQGFACGDEAQALLLTGVSLPCDMFQEALHARGAQLAAHRAGRVLQRLNAIKDEQCAFAGNGVRQEPALVPRRKRRLALHAEPLEGVGEERVFGCLPVFLGALAVEAPRIDALRAEPPLALEALEPVLD